jgi:hypothetical protein
MFVPFETNNKDFSKNIFLENIYGVYGTKIIEDRTVFVVVRLVLPICFSKPVTEIIDPCSLLSV